jgi:DNA segregation ATPase FtsK/SpoIIIE, S-DNA-T family
MTSTKLTVLAIVTAAAATMWCVVTAPGWFLLGVVVLAAAAVLVAVIRFARLAPDARRYWPAARWGKITWHRLARNLQLAYVDRHHGGVGSSKPKRVNYPRARFAPDPFGFAVKLKLIPGVSRAEVEKVAEHLANAWGAWRVGITQPQPNRLLLRAVRRDPLAEPLGSHVLPAFDGRHLMLGRDEWGSLRSASLAGISGSVIGGNPGRGKSECATAFAVQLAPAGNSEWYILDGGGGADWSCWQRRAVRFCTDGLAEARDVLEGANSRMVKRLATLTDDLGTRNAWTRGPTGDYPLVWVVLDESSVFLDLERARSLGKDAETQCRAIRSLVMGLLQRGRKALYHTTLLAQKPTSTSVPPDIRDLAGLRLCFGVATTEAGIAVLGDDLRQYPSVSPTGLQGDEHVGVCVARMKTGADPYTRLRVPHVDEDQADAVARQVSPAPVLQLVDAEPEQVPA